MLLFLLDFHLNLFLPEVSFHLLELYFCPKLLFTFTLRIFLISEVGFYLWNIIDIWSDFWSLNLLLLYGSFSIPEVAFYIWNVVISLFVHMPRAYTLPTPLPLKPPPTLENKERSKGRRCRKADGWRRVPRFSPFKFPPGMDQTLLSKVTFVLWSQT